MEAAASAVARTEGAPSARARDREAADSLYECHFDDVFDFALRVLRNRDAAAVVVREVFSNGRVSKADLYAAARDSALEQLRYRRRLVDPAEEREGFVFTRVDAHRVPDPSAVLFDRELVELVWECAAALSAEDYALLDLDVRRGLGAAELGEPEARLARLRKSFEDVARSTLLATRARHTCAGLETSGTFQAVQQHAHACHVCRETRRRFVSPIDVLTSLAPVSPPRDLRRTLTDRLHPGRTSKRRRFRR